MSSDWSVSGLDGRSRSEIDQQVQEFGSEELSSEVLGSVGWGYGSVCRWGLGIRLGQEMGGKQK